MSPDAYPDTMVLRDARAAFFERAALGPDGGYAARWVRVDAWPLPFYFPNTRARVAAARLHDLHHVATGYASDWPGEAAIAAWELAAGCGRYYWAWVLNLGAFCVGLFLFPRALWRAFVRGRCATTLYHGNHAEADLLALPVGALRRQLAISTDAPAPGLSDALAFAGFALLTLVYHWTALLAGGIVLVLAVRALL